LLSIGTELQFIKPLPAISQPVGSP
jgi:hypothetical protein